MDQHVFVTESTHGSEGAEMNNGLKQSSKPLFRRGEGGRAHPRTSTSLTPALYIP